MASGPESLEGGQSSRRAVRGASDILSGGGRSPFGNEFLCGSLDAGGRSRPMATRKQASLSIGHSRFI